MGKAKKHKAKAKGHKPVNIRPLIGDPKRPETWGPPLDDKGRLARPAPKRCSIETMQERHLLTDGEYRAALEIQRVFVAITAGLFARAARWDSRLGRPEMAEWLAEAHVGRYKPWADALAAYRPTLEIVIDVVVDGLTVGEVDERRHWRKGMAADYLRFGLSRYAVAAGWDRAVRRKYTHIDVAA